MADQIRDAVSGHGWDFQVEPGYIVSPTPPTIDIHPGAPGESLEPGAFGELAADMGDGIWVDVRCRVKSADPRAGQEILFELLDPESELSLVQALYDDPTIGGYAADVSLGDTSGFIPIPTIEGGGYLVGVVWRFLVIPARS